MLDLEVRTEEELEAVNRVNKFLTDKEREAETGMPTLPAWAIPADQFVARKG